MQVPEAEAVDVQGALQRSVQQGQARVVELQVPRVRLARDGQLPQECGRRLAARAPEERQEAAPEQRAPG